MHSWRAGRWFSWVFVVEGSSYDPSHNSTTFDFSLEVGGNQGSRGGNAGQEFFIGELAGWFEAALCRCDVLCLILFHLSETGSLFVFSLVLAENVLDELDAPSEFYYNVTSRTLWLWYNGTLQPPSDGSVEVTVLSTLISAVGNQRLVPESLSAVQLPLTHFASARSCLITLITTFDSSHSFVTFCVCSLPVVGLSFLGLTFADTAPMYLHPHGTPAGGDWAVARDGA